MSERDPLAAYLPATVRTWLEAHYYVRIDAQAKLERVIDDPSFWQGPEKHTALFPDHGVVHVRDVAHQILGVLEASHGVLLPARSPTRLEFMKGYGVILAYLHDLGMIDPSALGRTMHPEFAAQAVFSPEFDDLIATIWTGKYGGVAERLRQLAAADALTLPPETVLRELLALSMGHSKRKVPITFLNDPFALRAVLQASVGTELNTLYHLYQEGMRAAPPVPATDALPSAVRRHYDDGAVDYARNAFAWLVSDEPEVQALVADVLDTVRALRCADALRKRGTVQKTSAGYEIFISQQTGNAVFALRLGDEQLYLLELEKIHSIGEANIAGSELKDGNLRITFHRGAFGSDAALQRAAQGAALIVHDIQADVLTSFRRPEGEDAPPGIKLEAEMQILLESVDDNPAFVAHVCERLKQLEPALAARLVIVPSLQNAAEQERQRYEDAAEFDWDLERRKVLLERLARSGLKTTEFDVVAAFRHVRVITLNAGEILIEAGAPASFVYLPLDEGLEILPLGGYSAFSAQPWMLLGSTGVIRGAERNARVVATGALSLLALPKDVYLQHWHRPYSKEELRQRLTGLE